MAVKKRRIPLRICIGCREKKPKKELMRIVRTPNGEVVLDLTGKKPGRGAYICPREDCLKKSVKGNRLGKTLQLPIPSELLTEITENLNIEPKLEG